MSASKIVTKLEIYMWEKNRPVKADLKKIKSVSFRQVGF